MNASRAGRTCLGELSSAFAHGCRRSASLTESALAADAEPLRTLVGDRKLEVSDFEFAAEAPGTQHDALLKVGAKSYLVCNNIAKTMAVIRAVAALARSLDITMNAEGIESAGQAILLRSLGCDEGQGFFFGKPQPAAELLRLLGEQVAAEPAPQPTSEASPTRLQLQLL